MPLGYRNTTGLTFHQFNDGLLKINDIPGDPGMGPAIIVINAIARGLPPLDPAISLQLFPSGRTSTGTDSSGNISAQATFFNSGNDILYNISGGGTASFLQGVWQQAIRGVCNNATGIYDFEIQFSTLEFSDFTNPLTDPPDNLVGSDPSWDGDVGEVDLDWDYTGGDGPDGFAVLRDGVIVASVPAGVTSYRDVVFAPGTYTYTIRAYKYPDFISGPSNSILASFGGSNPDISIVTDLIIDIALAGPIVFIGDPSGIYTLVKDKTHDTLYERDDIGFSNVKIPDPFIKTAFIPDK